MTNAATYVRLYSLGRPPPAEASLVPYITQANRDALDDGGAALSAGEMNYTFTCIALQYLHDNGLSYQSINDVLGALEGCKLEFYRRVAVPYEEGKRQANGDVYAV